MEQENKVNYYAIIPANVRYDKRLTPNAKLLYGEITALSNKEGCCWARNSYFANLYEVTNTSISKWISQLKKYNHIEVDMIYKKGTKEILNRYIRIVKDGIKEKLKDNITSINIKDINRRLSVSEETQNQLSFKNPLNKHILDIIKEIVSYKDSPFNKTRLPKQETDKISNSLYKVQSLLWDLHDNKFEINNELEEKFLKKNNISFTGKNNIIESVKRCEDKWEKVKNICLIALKNYICLFDKKYWPEDKKVLVKSLSSFFYNSITKHSWFLLSLFNKPKLLIKDKERTIAISNRIFPENEYGQKNYERSKLLLREIGKEWEELSYWRKIRQLYNWYEIYRDILYIYNKGAWSLQCSQFYELLDRVKEFAGTWKGGWNLNNFGKENKTWFYFIRWMGKEKGVNLEPDKNELLSLIDLYEREGRKIKYIEGIKKELIKRGI